jgi:hypothetical protein
MSDSPSELRAKLAAITERAWSDPKFRERLAKNAKEVAVEYGLTPRPGVVVNFHIDTVDEKNFSIPMPPPSLADASLSQLKENLRSLARLHAEVSCSTQWIQQT